MYPTYEKALLACFMIDPHSIPLATSRGCSPELFTNGELRDVYIQLLDKSPENGVSWTELDVSPKVADAILGMYSTILSPEWEMANLVERLKQQAHRARLQDVLQNSLRYVADSDDVLASTSQLIEELNVLKNKDQIELPQPDLTEEILADLDRGIEISTGFPALDWYTKGIERGAFWTLGGFSSHGKTTTAIHIAKHVASHGQHVTICSSEMLRKSLIKKMAVMDSGINPDFIVGKLSELERDAFLTSVQSIQKLPIEIYETCNLSDIKMILRKRKSRLYVVDYLQMIRPDDREYETANDTKRYGYLTRQLEIASKHYRTCIIATSQFSRPKDPGEPVAPSLSKFRGSGEIEENTDIGLLLFYPFQSVSHDPARQMELKRNGKDGIINLAVAKNRLHGLVGMTRIQFDRGTMTMKEIQ